MVGSDVFPIEKSFLLRGHSLLFRGVIFPGTRFIVSSSRPQQSHEKNLTSLSIESWLFTRDPCHVFFLIIPIKMGSIIYPIFHPTNKISGPFSNISGMSAAGMLDLSGAHGAAAAANAITSNRFSYSMNLKVGSE